MRLRVFHQHSRFLSILTRFVDYYSPFWGLEAIDIAVEPQGALTCRLSALAVLADSGLFCGLLLTVLVSRSDFQDLRSYVCITCHSSTLAVFVASDPFRGLLLLILGVPE